MRDLPSGTVTFLFTDIEGSTRLWEQRPAAMEAALARHDALAAEVIGRHGGVLVKHRGEGDSLFAVFSRAANAVSAACALQRVLVAESWPLGAPLRVRMALHTGDASVRDGDYFGPAVNRCARLRAGAHGGQILLSDVTRGLVQDELPPDTGLHDLGEHRLRDLSRPERIFQLLHPDLPANFPPLLSLDALPNNLPVQVTSFIGREQQMAEVKRLFATTRLLTLTGSGGCGKTRLALQVAGEVLEQYPDGVWLVELAPLADPAVVPQTVASALGVREQPGRPLTETLVEYLKPKALLLVLDNCEHLLTACARLADAVLRSCPRLRILASSREALGIAGERSYRVPSLSVPDPREWSMGDGPWSMVEGGRADRRRRTIDHQPSTMDHPSSALLEYEAVRLFVERAVFAQPTFAVTPANAMAVAQVCQRLDGIPLALELAAARVRVLSVEQIAERLDDRFRLLTGGSRTALPRQQTLRALIDWSYDLLSEAERVLLRRLSVFAGGWPLEAAEGVCAGDSLEEWEVLDLLTGLVDKSLVSMEAGEQPRYRLLETVRQYAGDRLLEAAEVEAVRNRHLQYFLALAEQAEPELYGPDQVAWFERLDPEHDNLRAALDWSKAVADPDLGLRLAGALWWFWMVRFQYREGWEWSTALLERAGTTTRTIGRAKALFAALDLFPAESPEGRERAAALGEECVALCRELGDPRSVALALNLQAGVALASGEEDRAARLLEESLALAREVGDRWVIVRSLVYLGSIAWRQQECERAIALNEEGVALSRELGDQRGIAVSLSILGRWAWLQGDDDRAGSLLDSALLLFRELGEKSFVASTLCHLGRVAVWQAEYGRAAALLEEGLEIAREIGEKWNVAASLCLLGRVAQHQSNYEQAAAHYRESLTLVQAWWIPAVASCLAGLGEVAGSLGNPERAARLLGKAEALCEGLGSLSLRERVEIERPIAATRAALGEGAQRATWAEGRTMALEEAVAYALQP